MISFKPKKTLTALSTILLALSILLVSCSGKHKDSGAEASKKKVVTITVAEYVIMEKVLSDAPGRPRTTLKILIPTAAGEKEVETALGKALADIRKDDPSLKAAIIWSYRTRAELNGSNYTLGKLEWSADGKDFAGQNPLSPNPKLETVIH